MKEYISQYKNYDDYVEFKPGYYLDALDQHRWKLAQIKQITRYGLRTTIEVHFDGFSNRYDTSYDLPSSHKLAPFRTHTLPYTGIQTMSPNRQQPQESKFATIIKEMSKISNQKNIQKFKTNNLNQFLRGQVFIMVDNIITKRNLSINLSQTIPFLQSYLREGIKLLINSSQYLKELQKQPLFDASLFTVHPKIAIILSNTEFLFIMNSLIGNKDQRAELIRSQRNNPNFYLPKKIKEDLLDNKVMSALDRIMKFKCVNGKTLPWSLKKQVCILYNFVIDQFNFEIPTDHRQMLQILDYMSYFSQKGLLQKQQQQKKSFKLIVSLIIHGNFQGRLRGLNQIKKVVESIFYKRKQHIVLELTNSDLLSFLIDNKNFNQQIFKRSLPLFAFFYSNKMLNRKQLLQILNLHKDKHQLELKGFFSTLAEFTYFLDAEVILQYFKDIVSIIPLDQLSITFIKDYTLGALNKNSSFKSMYCKEGWQLGLTYFWTHMTSQKMQIPFQIKQKMIQAFALLMAEYYYSKQIQKYIGLAIKGIANRKNLEIYYKLIDQILKISKGPRISKCIEAIERDISIVECVIEGIKNTEISDKMWECMFQFLEEVTYVSKRKITYAQIKQFWKLKVCRTYLLKFLRKYRLSKSNQHKSHEKIINKQLPFETIKEIIQKLFLDSKQMQDYQNINQQLYQTVDQLIIALNNNLENINYNYKHTIRTKNPEKIIALEFYYHLVNKCKSREIVEKSLHRIIQLCIRIPQGSRNINSNKFSNWKFLLDKLSKLKRYNLLGYKFMLEDLKGRMKSLNILEPDPVQLVVYNKLNQQKKMISVPRYTSLWKIRHIIGEQFNLSQLNFQMKIAGSTNRQTDFQKEQDFSTALITINKEGPSIFIVPTKFKHPHLEVLNQFYQYFVQAKGDQLYDMLSRQQGNQALQILNSLPSFKKVQQKLEKLNFKDPAQIFDSNSMLKLSYQLKLINGIKNMKYICNLIQKGFIPVISKILLNRNLQNNPQNYVILAKLMIFLNQIIKFSKMIKNAPLFNDNFLCELLHINMTISPQYVVYITKCFVFLRDLSLNKELLMAYKLQPAIIFQNKQIDKILQILFLAKTQQKLAQIIVQFVKNTGSQIYILRIAINILNNPIILQKQQSCRILFDVLSFLIDKNMSKELNQSLKRLNKVIHKQKIMQQSQQKQNELLIGVMSLMIKFIENKGSIEMLEELLGCKIDGYFKYLIEECLFNFKDPNKIRFKSSRLRELGYKFINKFSGPIKNLTSNIYRAMKEGGSWRKQDQWSISLIKQNPHVFTGLKNLAATCYINSLLQQLFFIENFRNEIIAIDAQKIDDKENIVLEIQNIFAHLKYSQTSIFNTSSLCKKFILDGQPIDPRIQTDVDEFFHSLMDKLQRNLNKISKKSIINNIFGGELSNLIVGSKCQHTSQRIQSFLSIRLQIKDKCSLEQAFKQFIKGEALQGDNAYFCQRCDQKVKAIKRVCLKTLPQILIITLKRFQFNYQTMEKFKLNTFCSFAQLINVLQYTKQGIQNDHEFDESNYQYKLKGVVIHYGISEAGHYTSYIQAQKQKWYYFDDEKITQFNVEELGNECFGGIQQNPFGDDEQKKKNAYLLFYQKVKKNAPKSILDISKAPIVKQVQQQNTRTKLINLLFEPNLYSFIMNMKQQDTKTLVIYFHLVFLRSAYKRQKLQQFYTTIQQIFKNNKEMSAWYLSQINQNFLQQFIFLADLEVRYIITGLIIEAFKSNAITSVGQSFLEQFIFFIGKKNYYPAGKILKQAMKIKHYQKFLLSFNIGDILYQFIKNPNKQIKYSKELKIKNIQNDFGFCYSVSGQRNLIDPIDFLQAIDSLKLNFAFQDLQILAKRAKRVKTQQSLAIIFVKKFIDYEKFDKIADYLEQQLNTVECVGPDQYIYNIYISIIEQFALIRDPHSQKRIQKLAKIYMKSLQYNLCGYRCHLLLLLGLFRICSANDKFRDRISEQFQQKEGKKLLKDIKTWIRQINQNLPYMIRCDKMGVWRKPKGSNQSLEYYGDEKIKQAKIQQSLNAIIQKHNSFLNSQQYKFQKDEIVKYNRQKCRYLKSYGIVSQILLGDKHKIVISDELIKLTYY